MFCHLHDSVQYAIKIHHYNYLAAITDDWQISKYINCLFKLVDHHVVCAQLWWPQLYRFYLPKDLRRQSSGPYMVFI